MSEAYASSLHISFDVRGGLLMRQMHHWAALLFIAGMMVHMLRVFFTGAYRKPRELNWLIGVLLLTLALLEGSDRLLPPRRPALRRRSADHRGCGDLAAAGRHVDHVLPLRRRVPRRGRHLAVLLAAHPAHPGHPAGAHHRPHDPDVGAEAHPDAGQGPHERERGRRAVLPGLHGQGRRLLHVHLRRDRAAGHLRPDQPDLAVRPLQPGEHLRGLPARLLHGLPRGRAAPDARLGDQPLRGSGARYR